MHIGGKLHANKGVTWVVRSTPYTNKYAAICVCRNQEWFEGSETVADVKRYGRAQARLLM